jgi:RND family efflux transporter MFP subunit
MANEDISSLRIDKSGRLPGRRRGRKIAIAAAAAVAVLLILYLAGVLRRSYDVEGVTVSEIYPYQTITLLNASGYVVAQRKAAVASKITSRLEWIGVEEGSRVRKGQIIGRLEGQDVEASRKRAAENLRVAAANLDQAKAELHDAGLAIARESELVRQGVVAQSEYDAAEARYKKAKAAVSGGRSSVGAARAALLEADVSVEYTLIRAPFDAVVLTKNADVGDIVTPLGAAANAKASIVSIADLGSLQVEADVSESNVESVRLGQPCEIKLGALPEERFRGKVHMIVPTADRSKATVLVKVVFVDRDPRILPEMSAAVAFLSRPVTGSERRPRKVLPPSAVVTRDGRKVAFVVKDGKAFETPVTVTGKIGDFVEIAGGPRVGEKVVLAPPDKLKDRSKIKLKEK